MIANSVSAGFVLIVIFPTQLHLAIQNGWNVHSNNNCCDTESECLAGCDDNSHD